MSKQLIFEDQPDGPYLIFEEGLLPFHRSILFDVGGGGADKSGMGAGALYAWIAVAVVTAGGDWSKVPGVIASEEAAKGNVTPKLGASIMDADDPYGAFSRRARIVRRLPVEAVNRLGLAALKLSGIRGEEGN